VVRAGTVFGLGRNKTYELVKAGEFPTPVMRLGRNYRVAVAELLAAVGTR
jgi:predicted DNA-binding transcriptional regulator AlpA